MFSKKITKLLALLTLTGSTFQLIAQNEKDFYNETINNGVSVNIKDYGAVINDGKDDSRSLRRALEFVAKQPKGGKIYFPKGTYRLKFIKMLSNTHLVFHKDAIIKLPENDKTFGSVFDFGRNESIKNVSIRGEGGKFTIDLRGAQRGELIMCFRMDNVSNFKIKNVHIIDNQTIFSQANFAGGKNGILDNLDVKNTSYGYGLVQVGIATNVLFKNLDSEGGVALRIERDAGEIGANDIVGRNITGRNGNSAVMLSPHSVFAKNIDIDGVTSISCSFGVRVERGFGKLGRGRFTNVKIHNIKAVYGTTAQIRTSHRVFVPCELKSLVGNNKIADATLDGFFIGPAIAAVIHDQGNGEGFTDVDFGSKPIELVGNFKQRKKIINQNDSFKEKDCKNNPKKPTGTGGDSKNNSIVTVYENCGFKGRGVQLKEGKYTIAQLASKGIKNDDISSIKVTKDFKVTIYQNNNFKGYATVLNSDISCLINNRSGRNGSSDWNDDISSIRIERKITPQVMVYKDCGFNGKSVVLKSGNYTISQLANLGILNDDISSIKIPNGYKMTIYQHNNFRGYNASFTSDTKCLSNIKKGRTNDSNWNDDISSIRIEKTNNGAKKSSIESSISLSAYPNPFKSNITIDILEDHNFNRVELLTMMGQKVISRTISTSENIITLNTSNVAKGAYVIQLLGNNTKRVVTVIKE
ncbi:beta/gamma crystallin-related protein [Aquimarina agarilytica]|uniref:beta/gamma crystallin-related protein n=1 Tax=Aquimarina agarilytica TaxID=1087449 RepID=UPI0002894E31|nr:beta/gamma crystallin-related protein [Aquimarina agarilytica]